MSRFLSFAILITFLLLTACFSSKKAASEQRNGMHDPVITSLDTTTWLTKSSMTAIDTISKAPHDVFFQDSISIPSEIKDSVPEQAAKVDVLDSIQMDLKVVDSLINDTICIIGTGDIMPGTNYPDSRYLPPNNDCNRLFQPVKEILQSGDITFGNLEGVFCAEGGKAKVCNDPKVCYVFRMPDSYLDCILEAGYDVLSVANNHVNDFGYEGRLSTAKLLQEAGVPFAGFRTIPSTVFEKDGIKYGFAAFAPHTGTLDLKDYAGAAKIVSGLDSICDIVIVSFHGGAEGRDYQHVPCTDEEYLGYNRGNVCRFAHTVVDAGADVIFGHGPHVTRAMELYKGRLICYSLGNFCTYARFNLSGPNGITPIVKVQTNRKGEFLRGEVIPIYQAGEGGPRVDPQERAIRILQELTISDFPDTKLHINNEGILSIKK